MGRVLSREIVADYGVSWALERNLNYDLRIGEASYKRRWAPRTCNTNTWYVAPGLLGMPFVLERARVVGKSRHTLSG